MANPERQAPMDELERRREELADLKRQRLDRMRRHMHQRIVVSVVLLLGLLAWVGYVAWLEVGG